MSERSFRKNQEIGELLERGIPPLVFFHGLGNDLNQFASHRRLVENHGVHTFGYNFPPFNEDTFNFAHHGPWIKERIEKLRRSGQVKEVGLIGQSRGSLGILQYLSQFKVPKDEVSFAFLNSPPAATSDEPTLMLRGLLYLMRTAPESVYQTVLDVGKRFVGSSQSGRIKMMRRKRMEFAQCFTDHMNRDWSEVVKKIDPEIPITVRFGTKDWWLQQAGFRAVYGRERNYIIFDDEAGHDPPTPEVLFSVVEQLSNK